MKKFTIPCDFTNGSTPFELYIGDPKEDNHPLSNQSNWLASERGGKIPQNVMDAMAHLHDVAKQHGVPFEELAEAAIKKAYQIKQDKGEQ